VEFEYILVARAQQSQKHLRNDKPKSFPVFVALKFLINDGLNFFQFEIVHAVTFISNDECDFPSLDRINLHQNVPRGTELLSILYDVCQDLQETLFITLYFIWCIFSNIESEAKLLHF
jgi:hypothetical protein